MLSHARGAQARGQTCPGVAGNIAVRSGRGMPLAELTRAELGRHPALQLGPAARSWLKNSRWPELRGAVASSHLVPADPRPLSLWLALICVGATGCAQLIFIGTECPELEGDCVQDAGAEPDADAPLEAGPSPDGA